MGYWSVAALIISVSFLAYKHPPSSWQTWKSSAQTTSQATTEKQSPPLEDHVETEEDTKLSNNITVSPPQVEESESTPKAVATKTGSQVPSFSLSNESTQDDSPPPSPEPTVPSFPAANSAQRASSSSSSLSSMPLPPRPTIQSPASNLMPPPPRPVPTSRSQASPNSAASLRIPASSGPLPNRGPPMNSQQRASGSLMPTNGTAISTPNPRNKVLLKPGHSPMDWAALIRSPSANLTGVPQGTLLRVPPSQLRTMTGRKGKPAWSSYLGKVYNITPYLPFHPGGEAELMKAAGRDGGKLFMEVHPWVNWENMLGSCLVGVLVSESEAQESELDEMD